MTTRSDFGNWAEDYVAQYLESKGYKIKDKNYRKPWGEIDIIADKASLLVFVEVKANKSEITGFEPENRAGGGKLKRVLRAAQTYLAAKKYSDDQEWQIDIVALTLDKDRGVVKLKHFKNIDM